MSMSKRRTQRQQELWIHTADIATPAGHPFYQRLNDLLEQHGFDPFAEEHCAPFYAETLGRPSIPPGVYFRMLLIGYFEGIDSERGIAWRCADSLGLRAFLGYDLTERTPDHSSLSRIRSRIDIETHREIFQWVLKVLAQRGLLKGKTIGIDATTLEANAVLRSIVRRDTDQPYEEFLRDLARSSGIETPTREDLATIDRKRPKKGSNDEWYNPHDPDAKITKMKDGRTHLAHKAEQAAVYGNRRRIRGQRGKALLRKRGELLERPFAHCYETGGMRRTHLKGHERILKRLLIHVAGCNLALVMRTLFGLGTPRGLQGLARDLFYTVFAMIHDLATL